MRIFYNYLFLLLISQIFGVAGCILFGLQEIPCADNDNCPSGQTCLYPRQDTQFGQCFTAAQIDEYNATHPEGFVLSGDCEQEPCHIMPDSSSYYCADDQGPLLSPPRAGEPFFGQDCNYRFLTHHFSQDQIAINSLTSVDVLVDSNTGLAWEAGKAGASQGATDARQWCQGFPHEPYGQWNLPYLQNIMTLVDYGRVGLAWAHDGPTLNLSEDANFFVKGASPGSVGFLNLVEGSLQFASEMSGGYGLCVGGEIWNCPAPDSMRVSADSVEDYRSGLIWARPFSEDLDWQGALAYCQNLSLDGHNDWRLPSAKELTQLVDLNEETGYCRAMGEHLDWPSAGTLNFWTSTPFVSDGMHNAWTWFLNLHQLNYTGMNTQNLARCVRRHSGS